MDSVVNATQPDTSIGGYQKDRKLNGRSVSMAVSIEDWYRWKTGIDGKSVSMEDRYRWKIGIDGRSVSMEDRNENPDTGSIERIVN
jgi:hypothetical protein